jgi:SAM-dependent methyltransferase
MAADAHHQPYSAKIRDELERYADQEEVHDLPEIYHFWSEQYCIPLLKEVGFDGLNEFFDTHVADQCARVAPRRARLVSLGAGNGDTEIGIAERLDQRGVKNLELVLLELNPAMLDRARAAALDRGMDDRVRSVPTDLNSWRADGVTDIYFANHSLHHVVELESVFSEIEASMSAEGVLLVNDMIGRNGHVRWPEAKDLVDRIWSMAPERYRWNRFQQAVDERYPDFDCSTSGFEGIRSQDILPLLLGRFHPEDYLCFANVVDPFVDRIYGPNFDATKAEDLAFIDAVGRLDDAAIDLQLVTPTHLIAAFRTRPVQCRYPRERSPQRTVRSPTPESDHNPRLVTDDQKLALQTDLTALRFSLEEAWGRYHHLRQRKAVRIALALAGLPYRRRRGRRIE